MMCPLFQTINIRPAMEPRIILKMKPACLLKVPMVPASALVPCATRRILDCVINTPTAAWVPDAVVVHLRLAAEGVIPLVVDMAAEDPMAALLAAPRVP